MYLEFIKTIYLKPIEWATHTHASPSPGAQSETHFRLFTALCPETSRFVQHTLHGMKMVHSCETSNCGTSGQSGLGRFVGILEWDKKRSWNPVGQISDHAEAYRMCILYMLIVPWVVYMKGILIVYWTAPFHYYAWRARLRVVGTINTRTHTHSEIFSDYTLCLS